MLAIKYVKQVFFLLYQMVLRTNISYTKFQQIRSLFSFNPPFLLLKENELLYVSPEFNLRATFEKGCFALFGRCLALLEKEV